MRVLTSLNRRPEILGHVPDRFLVLLLLVS